MRLWSLHPRYLDRKGLLAVWREGILAKKVLQGQTRGYRNHPQLLRFKRTQRPIIAINSYLRAIQYEAVARGYRFDAKKVGKGDLVKNMPVPKGQVDYEIRHLLKKLKIRDPEKYKIIKGTDLIDLHPLFKLVKGDIEPWEKRS